jgi:hypothetical protein
LAPGRRTNRKNFRNCQRTIVFYTFYFSGQSKKKIFMFFAFNRVQLVHRVVQREWCSTIAGRRRNTVKCAGIAASLEISSSQLISYRL